jgi:Fic family protein
MKPSEEMFNPDVFKEQLNRLVNSAEDIKGNEALCGELRRQLREASLALENPFQTVQSILHAVCGIVKGEEDSMLRRM